MATITEVVPPQRFVDVAITMDMPGPFDFAGRRGPPNETMAPEHLAVCVVYGDTGRPEFGSYVVYPSADRRGPSRSLVLVKGDGSLAGAHEFNRAMIHAVRTPFRSGEFQDKFIWP